MNGAVTPSRHLQAVAETVIVPVRDILDLGTDAPMKMQGGEHDNWSRRHRSGTLTAEHAEKLRRLAEVSSRL
jgi:4-alpha-glucanotransferase